MSASGECSQRCGVRIGQGSEKAFVAEAAESQLGLLGHGSPGDRVRQEVVAERGIEVGGKGSGSGRKRPDPG